MALAFQISHAELLLLLGLLELPRPFALGQSTLPARPVLEGALSAAAGSLMARDLLTLPAQPDGQPTPHAELAALLRVTALADSLLIVVGNSPASLFHISRAGDRFVLHQSPAPDVHRFEALTSVEQIPEIMLKILGETDVHEPDNETPVLLPGEAVLTAFNALQQNDVNMAMWALQQRSNRPEAARALVEAIGPKPTRYALAAIRQIRDPQSEARGALVITGRQGSWWAAQAPDQSDLLALWPVGWEGLRKRVREFGAWICEAA
ncbi:hypothetical protein [Chloroflexus sp.]|uniref:hypothetical protein n=1 Tax=Chloroflexus sp. TaxID=1904827 RepID=UPI002613F151|nr:hypothetical protein [uncultured Chloroflexus sp.]